MYTKYVFISILFSTKVLQCFTFGENIIPSNSNCTSLKDKFADCSAQFTLCAIQNSRPIKMCETCRNEYLDVLNSYTNMSKEINNGTSCLDWYINSDRLQIVLLLYQNNVNLWNKAKCDECFDIKNGNVTISEEFRQYFNMLTKCVNGTTKELCSECLKYYVKLNQYFKSVSNVNDKIGVCMDLVDMMNSTWTFWSVKCCNYRRHEEYIFIGSTILVLISTISFYFIIQFCKEKNAPTIIQQSRFFESLRD